METEEAQILGPVKMGANNQKKDLIELKNEDIQLTNQSKPDVTDGVSMDDEDVRLVAFVNFNSGGKMGKKIAKKLQSILGIGAVFNLAEGGPAKGLKQYAASQKLFRVVVCGGDGTVNWVLSVLNALNIQASVGIIPLGTGNDAAREFGWGHKFPGMRKLERIIREMKKCPAVEWDRWSVKIKHHTNSVDLDIIKNYPPSVRETSNVEDPDFDVRVTEFNNYMSFGVDAQINRNFHHKRETCRECFCCRPCNMAWFGFYGLANCCCCQALPFDLDVQIRDEDGGWKKLEFPRNLKGIIILNLQTYAGGRRIWGKGKSSKGEHERGSPSISDGKFEVLGVKNNIHLMNMVGNIQRGIRLAIVDEMKFTLTDSTFVQVDGEPWRDAQSEYHIKHLNVATMLQRQKI